jgi:RNA polymerase sigma-54 factor
MKPSLSFSSEIQISQQLKLSANMQQAFHILSLPILEIKAYLISQTESLPSEKIENRKDDDFEELELGKMDFSHYEDFEEDRDYDLKEIRAPKPSLLEEIQDLFTSEKERFMAEILFGHFDKNGLIKENISDLANHYGFDREELFYTLEKIQITLQNGIGATSFQEALLIQVKSPIAYTILEEHYQDFLHNRHDKIAKKLSLPLEKVKEIIKREILTLKLPSIEVSNEIAPPIYPDIIIEYDDFKWDIEIPLAEISPSIPQYKWLQTICAKRTFILKKIALYLTEKAPHYLRGEDPYLPPLLLKDLAHETNLHESTITRAVAHKYIFTPRGILPLRQLFSLPFNETQDFSIQKAKLILLELIKNEKQNLSDEALSLLMKGKGIPIERRTVTKYRNELGISPKRLRLKT